MGDSLSLTLIISCVNPKEKKTCTKIATPKRSTATKSGLSTSPRLFHLHEFPWAYLQLKIIKNKICNLKGI